VRSNDSSAPASSHRASRARTVLRETPICSASAPIAARGSAVSACSSFASIVSAVRLLDKMITSNQRVGRTGVHFDQILGTHLPIFTANARMV